MTSAVSTAMPRSASTAMRDSRTVRSRRGAGARRARTTTSSSPIGEARAVLVDERLAVEAERLRVGAEEALDVRRRGQDVEPLVLERAQVLRPDLRARFELGKVELLAEARLAEAGSDVEHERASVEDMS